MTRHKIIALLKEYHNRYHLQDNFGSDDQPFSTTLDEILKAKNIFSYFPYFGHVLSWIRCNHPCDDNDFKTRLLAEINKEDRQNALLDLEYTALLNSFTEDLKLLIPANLHKLCDKNQVGSGDILIDLLFRRNPTQKDSNSKQVILQGPQQMHPLLVEAIVSRIPEMYSLVLSLKNADQYSALHSTGAVKVWTEMVHPIRPLFPLPLYKARSEGEYNFYISRIHDLLQHQEIIASVCKRSVDANAADATRPNIWSDIINDFMSIDPDNSTIKFHTKQAAAEHVFMRDAEMMQESADDDTLKYNPEIVLKRIRSSLSLARFIYLNYAHATEHLKIIATALTSPMTRGLIYYIGAERIQDMNIEQAQVLIEEMLKLPRHSDATFALFLKSFTVKSPILSLTNG